MPGFNSATKVFSARIPVDDATALDARAAAAGMTRSDWLRWAAAQAGDVPERLTRKLTPARAPRDFSRRKYIAADPALIHELARWGANLNGLAHRMHGEWLASATLPDFRRCAESLLAIERGVQEIRDAYVK